MLPEVWGRHLWFSIHFIAHDYPQQPSVEDIAAYRMFFENLWKVIPCYKCGVNYRRHLEELPIDGHLESRDALFAWTVELHNIVNKELGKPVMSLAEAKKKYSDPEFNKHTLPVSVHVLEPIETQKVHSEIHTSILMWIGVGVLGVIVGILLGRFGGRQKR